MRAAELIAVRIVQTGCQSIFRIITGASGAAESRVWRIAGNRGGVANGVILHVVGCAIRYGCQMTFADGNRLRQSVLNLPCAYMRTAKDWAGIDSVVSAENAIRIGVRRHARH